MNLEGSAFKDEGRSPAHPSWHLSCRAPEGWGFGEGVNVEAGRRSPALLCFPYSSRFLVGHLGLTGVGKGEWYPSYVEYRVQVETSGIN